MTGGPESEIIERTIDPDGSEPNYHVLETIAEVEDVDVTELPAMYERIDHMLDELYSDPPADEAQVEISFSYYSYRITATQKGTVTLRKLEPAEESPP